MARQLRSCYFVLGLTAVLAMQAIDCVGQSVYPSGWKTNWEKRSVDLAEIVSGGVPKDGIPPIDRPGFVSSAEASSWLAAREPVILLSLSDDARAYPLQIMTYHEIVNDVVDGKPVVVTFCPLCYSAIAYSREVDGRLLDFGVSGMLRHSDLIMYDRQTESLWQQIGGEAIVGDLTGTSLEPVPAQIVSFEQFTARFPTGKVLSRDTGHRRDYGTNPYSGYDDIDDRPFLYRGDFDDRLPPMEKVVGVTIGKEHVAYPHSVTRDQRVINDEFGGIPLLVMHVDGAVTALGDRVIREAEIIGTTGVFDRRVGDRTLTFAASEEAVRDRETGSTWDATGRATDGPLTGAALRPVRHANYFSFAWFAFRPDSGVYGDD